MFYFKPTIPTPRQITNTAVFVDQFDRLPSSTLSRDRFGLKSDFGGIERMSDDQAGDAYNSEQRRVTVETTVPLYSRVPVRCKLEISIHQEHMYIL